MFLIPGRSARAALALLAAIWLGSCGGGKAPEPADLVGTWRAVLKSPGGELPFTLRIAPDGEGLNAIALNGNEEAPFTGVDLEGDEIVLRIDWYDSTIRAELDGDGVLRGIWRRAALRGESWLPFLAVKGDPRRFVSLAESDLEPGEVGGGPIDGDWRVEFHDDSGTEPARGEFRTEGSRVLGTFLLPSGDYRFLEGSYENGLLRLSTFDGAHAFLFHARMREDGSLAGDFWSRDTYHATWTGTRIGEDESVLPDAWTLAGLTNEEGRFRFAFPDLDGNVVTLEDPRFQGKVVLVNIFGSWCPNCNDKAPLLADWYRRYRDQGFEIVGIAYEHMGDPERDREMVRRFAERHDVEYPLLLGGVSDKGEASATLPDLSRVVAFPTTVFIRRDGTVHSIHSGFAGPGTGEHHEKLVAELEARIEALVTR